MLCMVLMVLEKYLCGLNLFGFCVRKWWMVLVEVRCRLVLMFILCMLYLMFLMIFLIGMLQVFLILLLYLLMIVSQFCGIEEELCIIRWVFGMCVWIFLMCWIDRVFLVGGLVNLQVLWLVLMVMVRVLILVFFMKLVVFFGLVSNWLWFSMFFVLMLFFLLVMLVFREFRQFSLFFMDMLQVWVNVMVCWVMWMLQLQLVGVLLFLCRELFIIIELKFSWMECWQMLGLVL